MKIQNINLVVIFAFLFAFCIGCSDEVTPSSENIPPSEEETNFNSALTNIKYEGNAVMLGLEVKPDVAKACKILFPNRQESVTKETDLLIIPSGKYEEEAKLVKEQGGIVAIVNPSEDLLLSAEDEQGYSAEIYKNNLDEVFIDNAQEAEEAKKSTTLFDSINWDTSIEEEAIKNNGTGEILADFDSIDPELAGNKIYTHLCGWVKDLNHYKQKKQGNPSNDENLVDKYFKCYHYSMIFPYNVDVQVRKLTGSKPDRIKGSGVITVRFDIFQIHCYEGQPGAGDYYIVEMTADVNNKDMYKGKWWNRHGGTYVRICGLYGKSFSVECIPCKYTVKNGKKIYEELDINDISFTAAGTPSPQTTINQVTYTSSHTSGVDAGISVSGGKDSKGAHGDVQGSIAGNWSWTNSKSYTISDMDIMNIQKGNRAGYELVFKNLPKFDWDKHRGFDEGNSLIYRSDAEIHSSWAWYMPKVKDDSAEDPIAIKIIAKAVYGSMSFISTKADLKTKTHDNLANITSVIKLDSFVRDRCTSLTFTNNLSGSTSSIAKINIYKGNETKACWEYTSTLLQDQSVTTTPLKVTDNYKVEFITTSGKTYKYKKNNGLLTLQWNLADFYGNKIYAKDDFAKQ